MLLQQVSNGASVMVSIDLEKKTKKEKKQWLTIPSMDYDNYNQSKVSHL